jgi:hypothetical protein
VSRRWIVCTGGDQWVGVGETPLEAAAEAFRRRRPEACGLITSVREPHLDDEHGYILATAYALQEAGLNFKLRDGAPDYAKEALKLVKP